MSRTIAVEVGETGEYRARRETLSPDINILGLPLFLIAIVLSGYSSYLLLNGSLGSQGPFPIWPFFLHCLAGFCTGLGVYLALGRHEESRTGWGLFTGVFAFLAGPVGVVGGILSYLLARGQPRQTPLTEVVKAEMFVTSVDEEEAEDLQSLDLKIREESQVEPIVDMLPLADIPTAIAIVNRLRERGERTDIELIREISNDNRPEVYQYALAILDKMEKVFAGEVYELAQEIQRRPRDAQLRVEMAKLHIDYIQSGLLDDSLESYYWELTLSHLFEAMLAHPNKPELGVDFAQLLAQQGLIQEAGEVSRLVLKKEPSLLQAQLLVLQSLFDNAVHGDHLALGQARKTALENAWAVQVPRKRTPGLGPTYDLAQFWFGGEADA
jgi:hypothetical protein